MSSEKLAEIRERWAQATPGPWYWRAYRHTVDLISRSSGHPFVMTFARLGMQEAQPSFPVMIPGRKLTTMATTLEILNLTRHQRAESIPVPNAEAIAAAAGDIADLLAEIDELEARMAACPNIHFRLPRAERPDSGPQRAPGDGGEQTTGDLTMGDRFRAGVVASLQAQNVAGITHVGGPRDEAP